MLFWHPTAFIRSALAAHHATTSTSYNFGLRAEHARYHAFAQKRTRFAALAVMSTASFLVSCVVIFMSPSVIVGLCNYI